MGGWDDSLPAMAMVAMQFLYAIMALLNRATLLEGTSHRVFIFYRQAIAALVICPVAYFKRRGQPSSATMGMRVFLLIFVTAFIGVILYQTTFFEGLYLASSSTANAAINITPALTFLIAAVIGLEQVSLKAVTSLAKIVGTVICVGGAITMALLRGPKLFDPLTGPKLFDFQLPPSNSLVLHYFTLGDSDQTWLLGCLCLFASCFCYALCLILQVPIAARYPDHLSISAWMCFLSTLQAGTIAFFLDQDPTAWDLTSSLELTSCLVSGILGSAVQLFVLSWCVSRKGPVFTSMFCPLCTVITTVLACILLHEEVYLGSLIGVIAVVIGLYLVLWGKAEEMKHKLDLIVPESFAHKLIKGKTDLEQPLLKENSDDKD